MARILMVSSEAAPFAKTGGLADVLGALPQALHQRGEDVAVILPRYRTVPLDGAVRVLEKLVLHPGWMTFEVDIWRRYLHGVPYYFVECPGVYHRDGIYGDAFGDFRDNHIRFAVLSHAALALGRHLFRPQILHLHDWQAALVAPYLRNYYTGDPTFFGTKLVFTIHNLGYQGRFWPLLNGDMGVGPELMRPDLMEFYGDVNLMKGGIVFSDLVTTVSPTYAREIQTPEFGEGLDGLLRARSASLIGILNGCDYNKWNPATDPNIAANYTAADLSGKRACKRDLLAEFGLPDDDLDTPVIGIVSRFARQKGFDLIAAIARQLLSAPIRLVVVGTGEPEFQYLFQSMSRERPDKVAVRIEYSERLAHKVEAGSDLFLMPSRYEPCGLNQMYSLRYGTLPLVRATGGLEDTVDDETGFKFWGYEGAQLLNCLNFAQHIYWDNPVRWRRMMRTAMGRDYSWDVSAAQYSAAYRQLLLGPSGAGGGTVPTSLSHKKPAASP